MEILASARLLLRPPTHSDAQFIANLMNSEGYLDNIGDRNVRTASDAVTYLQTAPIYKVDGGLGFNIVEMRSGAMPVGICGLVRREAYDWPDVGYAFLDQHAGKGFASEVATTVLDHGFADLRLDRILGITTPANEASRRVLEKCGMMLEKLGDGVCVYGLDRSAWAGLPPRVSGAS